MSNLNVSFQYDLDPRYGWAHIDVISGNETLVVISDKDDISYGFTYFKGEMRPTCICAAREPSECGCYNVTWDYYYE